MVLTMYFRLIRRYILTSFTLIFTSRIIGDTLIVPYRDNLTKAIRKLIAVYLRESYETHKYPVWAKCRDS